MTSDFSQIMDAVLGATRCVFPASMEFSEPSEMPHSFELTELGVLIGFTGQIKGSLFVQGEAKVFSKLAEVMFGMPLEGEMLESFVGEIGNMLAGNVSTNLGTSGLMSDITPPTVVVGSTKLSIRQNIMMTKVELLEIGQLAIAIALDIV